MSLSSILNYSTPELFLLMLADYKCVHISHLKFHSSLFLISFTTVFYVGDSHQICTVVPSATDSFS